MKQIQDTVGKVENYITSWRAESGRLTVAVDGYAGSGKTSVADALAKQDDSIGVLHLDDFIKHWQVRQELIENADDPSKVFEYEWYRYDELEKVVREFKNGEKESSPVQLYDFETNDFAPARAIPLDGSVLIIEGIFLLHPEHGINRLWDRTVYLKTDTLEADRKRIAREQERWGSAYLPEDHPENWTQYFKTAYKRYIQEHQPEKRADAFVEV